MSESRFNGKAIQLLNNQGKAAALEYIKSEVPEEFKQGVIDTLKIIQGKRR